jgi:hypothetical protein
MVEIRSGPRRQQVSPGPQAGLLRRWGLAIKDLVETEGERDDQASQRAERLAAFIKGGPVPNLWAEDLEPMLRDFHDRIYEELLAIQPDDPLALQKAWTLRTQLSTLSKWANSFDAAITLGAGALERIARRNLRLAASADVAKGEPKTG